jgi:hypothetical protein
LLLLLFCGIGAWTQGLHLELFHEPYICEGFFEIGSCELFSWVGFELWSSWSLPPEYLGLQHELPARSTTFCWLRQLQSCVQVCLMWSISITWSPKDKRHTDVAIFGRYRPLSTSLSRGFLSIRLPTIHLPTPSSYPSEIYLLIWLSIHLFHSVTQSPDTCLGAFNNGFKGRIVSRTYSVLACILRATLSHRILIIFILWRKPQHGVAKWFAPRLSNLEFKSGPGLELRIS